MSSVDILRPVLHKIIHKYGRLNTRVSQDEQEWQSGEETENDDDFSVYSDEYISQEEYSDGEEAEEEPEYVKQYTINLCTATRPTKRRKF